MARNVLPLQNPSGTPGRRLASLLAQKHILRQASVSKPSSQLPLDDWLGMQAGFGCCCLLIWACKASERHDGSDCHAGAQQSILSLAGCGSQPAWSINGANSPSWGSRPVAAAPAGSNCTARLSAFVCLAFRKSIALVWCECGRDEGC